MLIGRIDGVTAPEGRLLFATTNHIERLDPALSRPGRMDVWINFKNATRWQAEGIFKRFFPCKTSSPDAAAETTDPSANGTYAIKRKKGISAIPVLEEEELNKLAKEFASNIPEEEVSVAALQGFLLKNKARPRDCVKEVAEWTVQERETKEKLKKEKEEVSLGSPDRCTPNLSTLFSARKKRERTGSKGRKRRRRKRTRRLKRLLLRPPPRQGAP